LSASWRRGQRCRSNPMMIDSADVFYPLHAGRHPGLEYNFWSSYF
jgi:hypothetical protein